METIRTEIESESETEDELWDSPNSTTNLSMTETIHDFDKLEMKREKIEIELGIQYVLFSIVKWDALLGCNYLYF